MEVKRSKVDRHLVWNRPNRSLLSKELYNKIVCIKKMYVSLPAHQSSLWGSRAQGLSLVKRALWENNTNSLTYRIVPFQHCQHSFCGSSLDTELKRRHVGFDGLVLEWDFDVVSAAQRHGDLRKCKVSIMCTSPSPSHKKRHWGKNVVHDHMHTAIYVHLTFWIFI